VWGKSTNSLSHWKLNFMDVLLYGSHLLPTGPILKL
jgi:hypothetical protein